MEDEQTKARDETLLVTYLPKMSEKLQRKRKKLNVRLAFKKRQTVGNLILVMLSLRKSFSEGRMLFTGFH